MTDGPLWRVADSHKANHFLQAARAAFENRDVLSTTFLSLDNPVSLTRSSLTNIQNQQYYVAHKADGTRFVLVLDMYHKRPVACMVNRAGEVYATPVRAPRACFVGRSVFDGELCSVSGCYYYLVFNALVVKGRSLFAQPYTRRLAEVQALFSKEPRACALADLPVPCIESALDNTMFMFAKPTVPFSNLEMLDRAIFPCDGLVFTPATDGVRPGRNPRLLKWKEWNSVDVGFNIVLNTDRTPKTVELWWDDEDTGARDPVDTTQFALAPESVADLAHGFAVARRLCAT